MHFILSSFFFFIEGNKKEDEQIVADLNLKSNSSDSARIKSLSQQDLNSSNPISPTTAAVDTGGAKSKRNLAGGIQVSVADTNFELHSYFSFSRNSYPKVK